MRPSFQLTFYCVVFVFVSFLQVYGEDISVQYTGLVRKSHISHNGRHNVLIVENKYSGGSELSLYLVTFTADGRFRLNDYSLTPRYDILVERPDGNIGFVSFDTANQYTIRMYNPKKTEISQPLDNTDRKITQLQFSKDLRAWCYNVDFSAHPWASKKQKLRAAANRAYYKRSSGWIILTEDDYGRTKTGDLVFSDAEKETFTEWVPFEKPKKVPQLFTQLMPNITLETQVLWSPDSKYIYVLDRTGIWRLQLGSVFFPLWTQVVKKMDISRFEVSASGKALLYETALNPELKTADFLVQFEDQIYGAPDPYRLFYDIWMVDLSPLAAKKVPSPIQKKHMSAGGPTWMPDTHNYLSPRLITRGLHATFNPVGQTIEVSTLDGQYGILIETMKFSSRHSTGRLYD